MTDYKYNSDVGKWLTDIYAFDDGIRQPIDLQDYSTRQFKHTKMLDYFISLELAILIVLRSNSPVKQFYVKYLMAMQTIQDNTKFKNKSIPMPKLAVNPEILNRSTTLPNGVQLGLWS